MEDVTDLLNSYRECVRHIWNTNFLPLKDDEATSAILNVEYELFSFLVVYQLGRPTDQESVSGPFPFGDQEDLGFGSDSIPYLRVVPLIPPRGVPIVVEEEHRMYEIKLHTDVIDLRFIEYCDWHQAAQRDWQFYRARILKYPHRKGLEGKTILIEVRYAKIMFLETKSERDKYYA